MYDLGRKFVEKAYYKQNKSTYLNKDVARKALKVNNHIKTPKSMPEDIAKFNAKIDRIFEKHCRQMMQILQ